MGPPSSTHHRYDGFRFILVFLLLLNRYSPVTVTTLVVVVVDVVDFSLEPGFYQDRHTIPKRKS